MAHIKSCLQQHNVEHYGIAPASTPVTYQAYCDWLDNGYAGQMDYLKEHAPLKQNPTNVVKKAQSAIVFTLPYVPHPLPIESPIRYNRVALYAKGMDYHFFLQSKLSEICKTLQENFAGHFFSGHTDSSPFIERDLAFQAGLGWFGKNTCTLSRSGGSLFFIAEIFTDLNLPPNLSTATNHCGKCTRCLDACPTGAIIEPQKLDATKCISYWTIESKKIAPEPIRNQIGDWLFGCDICQTVCPWNEKVFGKSNMHALSQPQPVSKELIEELQFLLSTSNKKLQKLLAPTPLSRARGSGIKRNALIVIGNLKIKELKPCVHGYLKHDRFADLARWTLNQLEN